MKKVGLTIFIFVFCLAFLTGCKSKWLDTKHSIKFQTFWNNEVVAAQVADKDFFYNAQFLDFDTGSNKQSIKTDIYYFMTCGTGTCGASFRNMNGARFNRVGEGKPDRYTCKLLLDRINDWDWDESTLYMNEDFFSCVLTSEGRYGWVFYKGQTLSLFKSAEAEIEYYIWDNE